jgi:hypothetical protein
MSSPWAIQLGRISQCEKYKGSARLCTIYGLGREVELGTVDAEHLRERICVPTKMSKTMLNDLSEAMNLALSKGDVLKVQIQT